MEKRNTAQQKLHHLAQFLAAFSNSYLPKAEDDSQSNLGWSPVEKALFSRNANDVWLSLSFKDVMLNAGKGYVVKALDVLGLDHDTIDAWIRTTIGDFGLDASALHYDLGFRLDTPFDNFTDLDPEDEAVIAELSNQRDTTQQALEAIREQYDTATDIRIWPHHFDTGMLIDLSEANDMSKGAGLGYAIADSVSEVPYFYTYAWPGDAIDYNNLPKLQHGEWVTGNWNGAILPVTRSYDTQIATSFYREAVTALGNAL